MTAETDPKELLKAHEIRTEDSCVAWGFEFIAKWYGRLPWQQYPLQTEVAPEN